MKLPSPTEQLLRAAHFLRTGYTRWKVIPCPECGQRNRVDRWRLQFIRGKASCGRCGQWLLIVKVDR